MKGLSGDTVSKIIESTQIGKIYKRELETLKADISRLVKEKDDLQAEVNELSEKSHSIKTLLKDKENALSEKYQKKEAILDNKIAEQGKLNADVSAKKGELNKLIAENKDMEARMKTTQDVVNANDRKANEILERLANIAKYIENELDKI